MSLVDSHRQELGIEPICRELPFAPSSYHEHAVRLADPGKRSLRARRDDDIKEQIKRVHDDSSGLYGTRKVWRQMRREGIKVAKRTVERLMRVMGLAGARRAKTTIATVSNPKAQCPLDKVNRELRVSRPNALWVVDFTYVHTWVGFVCVAFVIDACARRVVGRKVSASATASFVLDALEQAVHARRPAPEDGLIHQRPRRSILRHDLHPAPGQGQSRPFGWQRRRQLRQRLGRDHQRALQGRSHLAATLMAKRFGRRNGNVALGRLVQQPPPLWPHRIHPARRG